MVAARADPADLCLAAAREAAATTNVPLSVLVAITQTETGRTTNGQLRPWPWTVNMEGEGHWFDSPDAALEYAFAQFNRGARSFDVGCFQINYRWHGEHFASIADMFDPTANALYAAQFLSRLHAETGDWSLAAGAYHSRTEEFATRYRARFDALRTAAIDAGTESESRGPLLLTAARESDSPTLPRRNAFPLLQPGEGRRALGSLVPLTTGG